MKSAQNKKYKEFLASKKLTLKSVGIEVDKKTLNKHLFDFQRDIVAWALRKGRASIFCDCGLGKTLCQLEWARHIPGKILILAPLAVAEQTEQEGRKFLGMELKESYYKQAVLNLQSATQMSSTLFGD